MTATTTHHAPAGATETAARAASGVHVHPEPDRATSIPRRAPERMSAEERASWHRAEDATAEALRTVDRYVADHFDIRGDFRDALGDLMAGWSEGWTDDLRPSELAAQDRLAGEAVDAALTRCMAAAREEAARAALAFAREYPDAPRAVR